MNINKSASKISNILKTIAPPTRLAILLAIGEGEACVCHLEAVLGKRQAYISQHLMTLRQAEILLDRRDGRYIYYRISDPTLLDLVRDAGQMAGVSVSTPPATVNCACPHCDASQPGYLPLSEVGLPSTESKPA
jgi:DNA-binding transcriptional ArsR family regulator